MNPILKGGVWILRPEEYEAFMETLPKMEHQIILYTLLFTGMRYVELGRFSAHAKWYEPRGEYIYLPPEAGKKRKRMMGQIWKKIEGRQNHTPET